MSKTTRTRVKPTSPASKPAPEAKTFKVRFVGSHNMKVGKHGELTPGAEFEADESQRKAIAARPQHFTIMDTKEAAPEGAEESEA